MPQITAETPKSEITIQGITFAVSAPYAEGHVLTAGEASGLNQLRLENVRNNFSSTIKKARDEAVKAATEAGQVLAPEDVQFTDAQLSEFADKLAELDTSYEFGIRRVGSGPVLSPVEKEARKIAREKITAALQAKGHKVKDLPEGWMDEKIAQVAQAPEIVKEAERRVKSVEKIAMDEINLDMPEAA